jgi:hypothetical protein
VSEYITLMTTLQKPACAAAVWAALSSPVSATETGVYEMRGIIPATYQTFTGTADLEQRSIRATLPSGAECVGAFPRQQGEQGRISCSDGRQAALRWVLDWQHGPGGSFGPTLMASMSQWGSGGWPRSAQIQTDALPISAVPCRRLSSVCSFFMAIPLLNRRSGRREGKTTGVLCIASESRPVLGGTALTLETPRSEIAIVQRPSECDSTRLRIARAWGRCERPTILNLELGLE